MDSCKAVEERQTLMQSLERLSGKCDKLRDLERLTERLNEKLNRTDGQPKCTDEICEKESIRREPNIVELFNLIADQLESSINRIGDNTERSMRMID